MPNFGAAMQAAKQKKMGGMPAGGMMKDDGAMAQHEQVEDAGWKKVIELCDSGDPQALEAIKEIAVNELQSNEQEEQGMEGGEEHV